MNEINEQTNGLVENIMPPTAGVVFQLPVWSCKGLTSVVLAVINITLTCDTCANNLKK